MAPASAHRAARSAHKLAARAALTTAGATASPVERESTRKVTPVRIVASSQRGLKADARTDKRKAAKRWGQSRR